MFYIQTFGIFYDHLVHYVFIWYTFSNFGIMYQEKSGNPGCVFRFYTEQWQSEQIVKSAKSVTRPVLVTIAT
jgi:hypothetical protein